jgi:uncharacterized OB-fold protein
MTANDATHHCQNCGQRVNPMANFCPNCGQPPQVSQSQPGQTQTQTGSMHPPQQSGPSAGKIIAWIVAGLAIVFIGIPIGLVALVILFRLLGLF